MGKFRISLSSIFMAFLLCSEHSPEVSTRLGEVHIMISAETGTRDDMINWERDQSP